ncbi:hypothetical protein D3C75_136100 [compost metagenome]
MNLNDWISLGAYFISFFATLYMILAHRKYLIGRIKKGVVNLFVLTSIFFLCTYLFKMGAAFYIRLVSIMTATGDATAATLQQGLWTTAMVGTTISLVTLAILTHKRRFDVFIYLHAVKHSLIEEVKENDDDTGTSAG